MFHVPSSVIPVYTGPTLTPSEVTPSPKVLWCVTDTFPKTGYATSLLLSKLRTAIILVLSVLTVQLLLIRKGLAKGPSAGKGRGKKEKHFTFLSWSLHIRSLHKTLQRHVILGTFQREVRLVCRQALCLG